jgi:PST family polysaccharide transporter
MAITLLKPGIRSILANTAYLSLARLLTGIVRAVYAVLLAGFLGAEIYGLFNYGLSWYLIFIPLAALGLDFVIIREIGRDKRNAPSLLAETFALRISATSLVALMCFIAGCYLDAEASSRNLLAIFSLALLGRGIAVWVQVVFIAYESSRLVLQQESTFRLLEVALGIWAVLSGFGIMTVAAIHAVCWCLQAFTGMFLIRKHFEKFEFRPDWSKLWGWVVLGLPFLIASFLLAWVLQGALVLYRHIHGIDTSMGHLALALQAMYLLGSVAVAVTGPALPVLTRSVDRGDENGDRFISVALRGGILLGGLLAITGFSLGEPVVTLALGDSYEETAKLLPWALLLITPLFLGGALGNIMIARGEYWLALLPHASGALMFSVPGTFFIIRFDTFGALISLGIGLLTTVVVDLLVIRRSHALALRYSVFYPLLCIAPGLIASAALADFNAWLGLLTGMSVTVTLIFLTRTIGRSEFRAVVGGLAQMFARPGT